jgi:hypothetical protein
MDDDTSGTRVASGAPVSGRGGGFRLVLVVVADSLEGLLVGESSDDRPILRFGSGDDCATCGEGTR